MPLRLLHLADLHLDRAFTGMGCLGDAARRRRAGLREALRLAGETAVEHGCAAVTIGGDLYEHERAGVDTARFLAETFASWPLRVLIAPGNHDPLLPGSLWQRAEWPANVHVFDEPHLRPVGLADGVTVWGLGHPDPAWMGDPLEIERVGGDGGVHLALFHGAEMGSRPEGKEIHGPFRAREIRERGFAAALSGHYHRRRVDTETGLLYPGSPEPLTFDEHEPRGPVLVEVADTGEVTFEPLALNRWSAVTITCDVAGAGSVTSAHDRIAAAVIAGTAGIPSDRTVVRVDLCGETDPRLALDVRDTELHLRETTGVAGVRVRDLTSPALDVETLRNEPTARGAFVRAALEQLDGTLPDERAIVEDALRYGLQALSGAEVGLR